jgi:hypothetical protein
LLVHRQVYLQEKIAGVFLGSLISETKLRCTITKSHEAQADEARRLKAQGNEAMLEQHYAKG